MFPAPSARAWAFAACLWPAVASAAPLTADDVVRYALEHHPDSVAASGAVDVATGDRRQAAVFLGNPEFDGSVALVGDRIEATAVQPISLTGEGWHARRAASLGRDAAEARLRRTTFVVAAEARNAWVGAVLAGRRAAIAEEALLLADQLRTATDRREEVGEGSTLESRLARLDEARAVGEALAARRDLAGARTVLAGLAPETAGAELADDLDLPRPSTAATERSDVLAAQAAAESARAAVRRQVASGFPLVGVGATVEQDGDVLTAGPAVGLQLPIWNRNQAGVASARRDLAVARADAERVEAIATAEQGASATLAARAAEDLERLGDPTDDARQALAAIASAFDSGELDVPTAVLLRGEVLDGWSAAVEAERTAAELTLFHLLSTEDPSLLEVTP